MYILLFSFHFFPLISGVTHCLISHYLSRALLCTALKGPRCFSLRITWPDHVCSYEFLIGWQQCGMYYWIFLWGGVWWGVYGHNLSIGAQLSFLAKHSWWWGDHSPNFVGDDTCPFQQAAGEAMGMLACNRGSEYWNNVHECAATWTMQHHMVRWWWVEKRSLFSMPTPTVIPLSLSLSPPVFSSSLVDLPINLFCPTWFLYSVNK